MSILDIINNDKKLIEQRIELLYSKDEFFPQMTRYAIIHGGKRIRPILFLESFKSYKKLDDYVVEFAVALELIHSYSLVHDDLPEMDDDLYRRGDLSVYGKYGAANAILVGDELLNRASLIMCDEIAKSNSLEEANRKSKTSKYLLTKSGSDGMVLGQFLDLLNKDYNEKSLTLVNNLKTGALFQAAIVGGALLAGASSNDINILKEFSLNLGLSFQLKDDLFDYEEDLKLNKTTFATLLGKDKVEEKINNLDCISKQMIDKISGNKDFFINFIDYISKREF